MPRLALLSLAVAAALGCGGGEVPVPTPDPASLRTTAQGEVIGFEADGAHVWRGLPFARPPTGPLRWRAPQEPDSWEGVREALAFGEPCVQVAGPVGAPVEEGAVFGSEDCLTLNVFAPATAPDAIPTGDARLPVMFWIHGGGNAIGDARLYDASRLAASRGVIVVTTQYRLNALGWFYHPALHGPDASAEDRSGNYGTLDLVRGLEWVRDHIAAFGGDPERVTVFGESAGGSNVYSLLLSPRAAGLFQRAIAQSGGAGTTPIAEAMHFRDDPEPGHENSSSEIMARLWLAAGRAPDAEAARAAVRAQPAELAAHLRAFPASELLAPYGNGLGGMIRAPVLIRDGSVLPDAEPLEVLATPGAYNAVPVMVGTNRDENKLFLLLGSPHIGHVMGLPLWVKDRTAYLRDAEIQSRLWKARGADEPARALRRAQGASVFGYRFDWDEEPKLLWLDLGELLGAAHGLEVPFVFGNLELGRVKRLLFDEARFPAALALAEQMTSYWTQFAATGDPGRGRDGSLPAWTAWGAEGSDSPRFLVLDTAEDGGLRMDSDTVSRSGVLASVMTDPRFAGLEERCDFYAGLVGWRISEAEYHELGDGACAAHPIDVAGQ